MSFYDTFCRKVEKQHTCNQLYSHAGIGNIRFERLPPPSPFSLQNNLRAGFLFPIKNALPMLEAIGFGIEVGTKFYLDDVGDFDGFEGLRNHKAKLLIAVAVFNRLTRTH